MAENNGDKRTFNRRARTGWGAIALITAAFYICMFKGIDLSWFKEYCIVIFTLAGSVILGISVTDGIAAWKSKGQ
jgi:hypothetical protein